MEPRVAEVASNFAVLGELIAAEPFRGGHINRSYELTYQQAEHRQRYLLQRINRAVFRAPAQVMENIGRVTAHVASRLRGQGVTDVERRVLTIVSTASGAPFFRDEDGECWRLYRFIEGTHVYESVRTPDQAERAGRAFGAFQGALADLPPPRLHETIRDFHNTPLRLAALEQAVATDVARRVAATGPEIEFALARRSLAPALVDLHRSGRIPERIVHNDAKISNVLLDAATGEALCVTDLDTVMPGLSLYDFGDMVRSMATTAAEDEPDLTRVEVELPLFEALARGYLSAAGELLTAAEREHLVTSGKLITYEQGLRFLTDYLSGDTYYQTQRPGQNLDRTRAQFKLLASLERNEAELARLVRRA